MAGDISRELEELCRLASSRADGLGHALSVWEVPSGEETIGRASVCRRCGRTAYVRIEDGLQGMAGDALTTACG